MVAIPVWTSFCLNKIHILLFASLFHVGTSKRHQYSNQPTVIGNGPITVLRQILLIGQPDHQPFEIINNDPEISTLIMLKILPGDFIELLIWCVWSSDWDPVIATSITVPGLGTLPFCLFFLAIVTLSLSVALVVDVREACQAGDGGHALTVGPPTIQSVYLLFCPVAVDSHQVVSLFVACLAGNATQVLFLHSGYLDCVFEDCIGAFFPHFFKSSLLSLLGFLFILLLLPFNQPPSHFSSFG